MSKYKMTPEELNKKGAELCDEGNYEEAVKLFGLAADQGNVVAQYNLAICYVNGYGVEQSYEEAVKWYRLAADQGYKRAQCNLGVCYEHGHGVEQSYEESEKWYKLAAEQGYAIAQCNLGNSYYNGNGVVQSYEEALKLYRLAADQGDARAQCNLGVCYYNGEGVEQSYEEAVKWYKLAAEQGYARAQTKLGYCYYNGYGVEQSYEESVKWFRLAADQGDALAQCNLGISYEYGRGIKQSYKEAVKWYRLAAEQGDEWAQYNLGLCYYNGEGVTQSYEEAVKWYRLAAEQEYASAQFYLGLCYYNGEGVAQSYEEAVKWYRLAADQGDEYALSELGYFYFYGHSGKQNFEKAKEYFEKASELGYDASYPLEMCNRELGIEDNNNYAREFIETLDSNNFIEMINNKLSELFDSLPGKLESKSKVFIKTGLITYYLFNKLQINKDVVLDYTSCITPLLKALENEIKKYFIDGYMRYLETNVDIDKCNNYYFINKSKKEYYDVENRFNKFALGDFKDVIGLRENMNVVSISNDKTYDDNIKSNRITVIDSTMLSYLKELVFDEDEFTYNIDGEIIDYLVNLNEVIEFLTRNLRNPAAHDLVMTREKAETTINYLLFTKQLLVKFYEKMK